MTLLDFYTAGTAEYIGLLFTALFGSIGLLQLATDSVYKKRHYRLLSGLFVLTSLLTWWCLTRLVGTAFLINAELQREFDGNQTLYQIHQAQVAQYDPIAITRFTSQFVGLWYWLAYLGFPLVVAVILIWTWYRLTRD